MEEVVNTLNATNVNPLTSVDILSNITYALIILLAGFAIGKLLGTGLFKILNEIKFDKFLKKLPVPKIQASKTLSSLLSWTIYTITVIYALNSLNILGITFLIILYFIGILILGTILLGLYFAAPNIAMKYKLNKTKIKKGDYIEIDNVKGEIIKIGLINTKLKGTKNETFIVPNKLFKKYKKKHKLKKESQAN